jgi:hypothetical protein
MSPLTGFAANPDSAQRRAADIVIRADLLSMRPDDSEIPARP